MNNVHEQGIVTPYGTHQMTFPKKKKKTNKQFWAQDIMKALAESEVRPNGVRHRVSVELRGK